MKFKLILPFITATLSFAASAQIKKEPLDTSSFKYTVKWQNEQIIEIKTGKPLKDFRSLDYRYGERYTRGYIGIGDLSQRRAFIYDLKTGDNVELPQYYDFTFGQGGFYYAAFGLPDLKYVFFRVWPGKTKNPSYFGIMDVRNFKTVLPPIYTHVNYSGFGRYYTVCKDGLYALLDSNFQILIDYKYEDLELRRKDSTYTLYAEIKGQPLLLDIKGNLIKELVYQQKISKDDGSGLYRAEKFNKWGFIDANDNWVIQPQFKDEHNFGKDDKALVLQDNGKAIVIDKKGNNVGKREYDNFGHILRESYGIYDVDDYSRSDAEYTPMKINGKWGYVDMVTGNITIEAKYDSAFAFDYHDMARVKVGKLYGFIDKKGNVLIEPIYYSAEDFDAMGVSMVTNKKGSAGLINRKGLCPIEGAGTKMWWYESIDVDIRNDTESKFSLHSSDSRATYTQTLDFKR